MTRPNLESLFTGNAPADQPMTWLNGRPTAPEPPPDAEVPVKPAKPTPPGAATSPEPPTPTPHAESTGMFDPVALAERYFAVMQALLDLQRDFGMRLAHQVAALPPMNRFRH